jgi:dihydropteroate synthase
MGMNTTTKRIHHLSETLQARNLIMGIINVTPDSFSDGGLFLDPEQAIRHAFGLIEQGADLLDIGGESTRPGSKRVSAKVQLERVLPVIHGIRKKNEHIPLSIDTTRHEVVRYAFEAGIDIVNDISALTDEPEIVKIVAAQQGMLILMHKRGDPEEMQKNTDYQDLITESLAFLDRQANIALDAGVHPDQIWLDPGIGFGKSLEGNLQILRNLPCYDELGYPLVIGVSRKSFIGRVLDQEATDRLAGTLAVTAWIAASGKHRIHRVHDVQAVCDCLKMVETLQIPRSVAERVKGG